MACSEGAASRAGRLSQDTPHQNHLSKGFLFEALVHLVADILGGIVHELADGVDVRLEVPWYRRGQGRAGWGVRSEAVGSEGGEHPKKWVKKEGGEGWGGPPFPPLVHVWWLAPYWTGTVVVMALGRRWPDSPRALALNRGRSRAWLPPVANSNAPFF